MYLTDFKSKNAVKKLFLMNTCCFFYCVCAFAQSHQVNFSSGRLFKDPETNAEIHSPYLACNKAGEQAWIAYDPQAIEGRFLSTSSSMTGAVSCGYTVGDLHLLGKQIKAPHGKTSAIAIHAGLEAALKWSYVHRSLLGNSKFQSVVKMDDGSAVISGYEYGTTKRGKPSSFKALLICINRAGKIVWRKNIPAARGYTVKKTANEVLIWMVSIDGEEGTQTELHKVDKLSGEELMVIREAGKPLEQGLKGAMSFDFTDKDEKVITARVLQGKNRRISLSKYDLEGTKIWSHELPYSGGGEIVPNGIVKKQNGEILIAGNLIGNVSLKGTGLEMSSIGDKDILLLSFSSNGNFTSFEQYGGDFAAVNGIFKVGGKVGIAGCHIGQLKIQNQHLTYDDSNEAGQSYQIFLEAYDPSTDLASVLADSTVILGGLTIYPNPVSKGVVNILNEQVNRNLNYKIHIFDNTGKLHRLIGKTPSAGNSQDAVDVSGLADGVYVVVYSQAGTGISTGRFIIKR